MMRQARVADEFQNRQFIDVGEAKVCYRRAGDGPSLVLLHGFPLSGLTWRRLVPKLSKRFTCYAFDLVGLGDSRSRAAADFSSPGQGAVMRQALRALGVSSYALLGNDTGGWVARELAVLENDRVTHLALTNTEIPGHRPPWISLYQRLARIPGSSFGFRRVLSSHRLRRSPLAFGGCFADLDFIDGEFGDLFVRPLTTEPERLASALRFMVLMNFRCLDVLREAHGKLSMPVAFLWGADDPTFPERHARAMLPQFTNVASFTSVSNAKLFFFYEEQPERVAEWVVGFLAGRHLSQERIQPGPVLPIHDGIYPDEDAVELLELIAHFLRHLLRGDNRCSGDIEAGEGLEDRAKSVVFGGRLVARVAVPTPQNAYPADVVARHVVFGGDLPDHDLAGGRVDRSRRRGG